MEYNFEELKFNVLRNEHKLYPSILKLYKETSNYDKHLDFVEKKYNTSVYNCANIGYLAFENNNVAAYYGVFPIRLTYKGTNYLAAQSGDTLTHPNYQKKGLFIHLAQLTYQLAEKEGIQFVFGFPNKNSFPGFQKKLNWEFDHKILEFVIKVNTLPLAEVLSKFNKLNNLYLKLTAKSLNQYCIDPNTISLDGFNSQTDYVSVKKDIDFFKYKTYNNALLIKKNNFLIYLKVDVHLIIGDVAYFEKSLLNQFIATIRQLAFNLFVYKIKFYLSPNHWLCQYLKEQFESIENNYAGFCFFNNDIRFPIDKAVFTAADFDTF
jgi:hypothetical protein